MKFGHFDDKAREYVIETPRTPYPWINYLGCEKFFGIISNTAGGYCFYRDAGLPATATTTCPLTTAAGTSTSTTTARCGTPGGNP